MSWAPQQLLPASEDTQARLLDLYRHTDTKLAAALETRIRLAALGRAGGIADAAPNAAQLPPGIARVRAFFAEAAGTAARYLARPDGPRVGALGFLGWDTHINEGAAVGQLANLLGALDGALAAIATNMDDAWRETAVAVLTEFGRTARINGTDGTDHGTGTVALLAGGALKGGRVIADWPKPADLHEGRDLRPTTDLRAVLKGLLRDHLARRGRPREHGVSGERRGGTDGWSRWLRPGTLRKRWLNRRSCRTWWRLGEGTQTAPAFRVCRGHHPPGRNRAAIASQATPARNRSCTCTTPTGLPLSTTNICVRLSELIS
jgi:hypothetical protein